WKQHNRFISLRSKGQEQLAQKSAEWHQQRKKTITGSRIANLLGMFGLEGYLKTFYDIYMSTTYPSPKKEEEISKCVTEEKINWGNYHENDGAATWMN